jgi:hypothetical protein
MEIKESSNKTKIGFNKLTIKYSKYVIIVAILLSSIVAIFYNQENNEITYIKSLELKLDRKEDLTNEEHHYLCRHYLNYNLDKYYLHCLNQTEQESKFVSLFEMFLNDSNSISDVEKKFLDSLTQDFIVKCTKETSYNKKNLYVEATKIYKSFTSVEQDKLKKNVNYVPKTKLNIYKILYYVFIKLSREKSLLTLNYVYNINDIVITIDTTSLYHIISRHYQYKYLNDNKSSLYKYENYDELILDLNRILFALQLNKEIFKDVFYLNGNNGTIYLFTQEYQLDIHFNRINNFHYKVITFYIYDPSEVIRKDHRPNRILNKKEIKLFNDCKIYKVNEN